MICTTGRWLFPCSRGVQCPLRAKRILKSYVRRGLASRRSRIQGKEGDQPESSELRDKEDFAVKELDPMMLVQGSSVFYGAMTISAIFLGKAMGLHVLEDLSAPVDVVGGLIWTLPMVVSLAVTVAITDRFPALVRIRTLMQTTLLPALRRMPAWGPIVLAVGAGVGEEALFRGWMQPVFTQKFLEFFSPQYATIGGVLSTSLLFGLGHAVTGTYFVWASVFGVLMGVECNVIGLPAVVFTHALYDWIAFVSLKELWKPTAKNND